MRVIKQYFKVEVEENRKEEKLLQPCVKILSVILQNGKKENENNKVYLSPQQYYEILEIVIDNLFKAETTALQQLLADAIADGVYFNPQLFMAGFKNQPEKLLEIIQNWFACFLIFEVLKIFRKYLKNNKTGSELQMDSRDLMMSNCQLLVCQHFWAILQES